MRPYRRDDPERSRRSQYRALDLKITRFRACQARRQFTSPPPMTVGLTLHSSELSLVPERHRRRGNVTTSDTIPFHKNHSLTGEDSTNDVSRLKSQLNGDGVIAPV